MKYVFIANPVSGKRITNKLLADIEDAFIAKGKGDRLIVEYTRRKGHGGEIAARYASEYGSDCVVVACGGDGTVHEISNALVHTDTAMMILPLGTGNDFAKKIYGAKPDAVKVARDLGFLDASPKFVIKKIDMGRCNDHYFIGVMSFGFDTSVEIAADKIARKAPFLGKGSYKLGLIASLFGNKRFAFHASLDGIDENGSPCHTESDLVFTLMAVCNSSFYGGGFCPAPEADLSDGIFDMCVAADCNAIDVIKLAPHYIKGVADKKSSKITLSRVTGGRLTAADGGEFVENCDGENRIVKEIDFSMEHKALRLGVICPDSIPDKQSQNESSLTVQ